MPNLRSYAREALLALPAGAELDELVKAIIEPHEGDDWPTSDYSGSVRFVGVMLDALEEFRHHYTLRCLGSMGYSIDELDEIAVVRETKPHVCALALCLAAWEKERNP